MQHEDRHDDERRSGAGRWPASRRRSRWRRPPPGAPRCRCPRGLPCARWSRPRTPRTSAVQPITWRPAGPVRSGLRMVATPTPTSSSGTNQPSSPTEPLTTVRVVSPTLPGQPPPDRGGDDDGEGDEHEADAVAAVLRLELARGVADAAYAQRRARGRRPARTPSAAPPSAVKSRRTGPGPLTGPRGEPARFDLEAPFFAAGRRDWLPDDRDRELEDPFLEEVPEARDRGGEDVRVAMVGRLRDRHTRHTHPTPHVRDILETGSVAPDRRPALGCALVQRRWTYCLCLPLGAPEQQASVGHADATPLEPAPLALARGVSHVRREYDGLQPAGHPAP